MEQLSIRGGRERRVTGNTYNEGSQVHKVYWIKELGFVCQLIPNLMHGLMIFVHWILVDLTFLAKRSVPTRSMLTS